ncbi:MAG: cation:proton antiporter [Thermodesulfobacteriota bacterium]|nr:cation:proton antiporter [Thermodesulfobacteriota bacterium]
MGIPLLNDIVIIFVLYIAILFICHRLRVPAIVGFFLAGILTGPYGLGLVKAVHEVELLAEVGVVLLLFTIRNLQTQKVTCQQPDVAGS